MKYPTFELMLHVASLLRNHQALQQTNSGCVLDQAGLTVHDTIRFWAFLDVTMFVQAVIKSQGPGISPGYYECGPWLLQLENRRKTEPKEIASHLIPCLLVVYVVVNFLISVNFYFSIVLGYGNVC